ncbi:hypothetical protein ABTC66_20510, partial [Acinetobacter baumannii]
AAAALAASFVVAAGLVLALGDPHGGEPRVQVAITMREPAARPAAQAPAAQQPQVITTEPGTAPLQRSAEEVETASGVTVVR